MEWVETTGRTIEEAKELALDQLGVDSGDAEFEVLEEPKVGLFGRTRGAARVRARVSPRTPRPKTERRRRSKKGDAKESGSQPSARDAAASSSAAPAADGGGSPKASREEDTTSGAARQGKDRSGRSDRGAGGAERQRQTREPREPMDIEEQIKALESFIGGLGSAFGLDVSVETTSDEDEIRVNVVGEGLGLLVGPRLATLDAIQEIARNALQRQADGREYARVVVDVSGIRQRRREALSEFVADAAAQVRDDDVTVVFDVMSSADRKIVHDVASDLEGVVTASEGEDPRRRVVLRKA